MGVLNYFWSDPGRRFMGVLDYFFGAVVSFTTNQCRFSVAQDGDCIQSMGIKKTRPPKGTGCFCPGGETGKHRGLSLPRPL